MVRWQSTGCSQSTHAIWTKRTSPSGGEKEQVHLLQVTVLQEAFRTVCRRWQKWLGNVTGLYLREWYSTPLDIIYSAADRAVKAGWAGGTDSKKQPILFTTSPNNWMDNGLGSTWLEQVFDRYTKLNARRKWRLLIIDSYGSHVTRGFMNYGDKNKILLWSSHHTPNARCSCSM